MPRRIHFLNVKNGDCSIIQHGCGHVSVIDVSCARLAEARVSTVDELVLLSRALGFDAPPATPLTGPDADKVAAILASPKADTFRRVIDDYYELIQRRDSDSDERRARG